MNFINNALAAVWKTDLNVNQGKALEPGGDWSEILTNITSLIFIIAGIVAFLYLIYSGFIYLTAGGNPDAAKKGQAGLLNSILGLVIIFMAYGIVRFVVSFLSDRAS